MMMWLSDDDDDDDDASARFPAILINFHNFIQSVLPDSMDTCQTTHSIHSLGVKILLGSYEYSLTLPFSI